MRRHVVGLTLLCGLLGGTLEAQTGDTVRVRVPPPDTVTVTAGYTSAQLDSAKKQAAANAAASAAGREKRRTDSLRALLTQRPNDVADASRRMTLSESREVMSRVSKDRPAQVVPVDSALNPRATLVDLPRSSWFSRNWGWVVVGGILGGAAAWCLSDEDCAPGQRQETSVCINSVCESRSMRPTPYAFRGSFSFP